MERPSIETPRADRNWRSTSARGAAVTVVWREVSVKESRIGTAKMKLCIGANPVLVKALNWTRQKRVRLLATSKLHKIQLLTTTLDDKYGRQMWFRQGGATVYLLLDDLKAPHKHARPEVMRFIPGGVEVDMPDWAWLADVPAVDDFTPILANEMPRKAKPDENFGELDSAQLRRMAFEMFNADYSVRQVAKELRQDETRVEQWKREWRAGGSRR